MKSGDAYMNWLTVAAIIGGAMMLFKENSTGGSRKFSIPPGVSPLLPNGGEVYENQLPQYGFLEYPAGSGQWYHQTQFQAPPGTNTNSTAWLTTLQNIVATGGQLYTTGTGLASQIVKTIKSTAVDWNNSLVSVQIQFGLQAWSGNVNPATSLNQVWGDQVIKIFGNGQQTKVQLIKAGQLQKESIIDFYNENLVGFSAGSTGVSGVYMSGIGTIYHYEHPKALTHCQDGTFSDSGKGACSYHGGAHEIKLDHKGKRVTSGKHGKYGHYPDYRKGYKKNWANKNKGPIVL